MCLVVGILTSVHDANQRILVFCPTTLSYEAARPVHVQTIQTAFEYVRVVIRGSALILLTILTVVVWIKYRKMEQKRKLIRRSSAVQEGQSLSSFKLLTIQIIQSVTLIITNTPLLYSYLDIYVFVPAGIDTLGQFRNMFFLVTNSVLRIGPGCNFIFYIVLSKKFRNAAKNVFFFWTTPVNPISSIMH